MPALDRRKSESIFVGEDIAVALVRIARGKVVIGVDASRGLAVVRNTTTQAASPCRRATVGPSPALGHGKEP